MTSTTNPAASFHSYENVVYDEQQTPSPNTSQTVKQQPHQQQTNYTTKSSSSSISANSTPTTLTSAIGAAITNPTNDICTNLGSNLGLSKNVVDSPFPDLIHGKLIGFH